MSLIQGGLNLFYCLFFQLWNTVMGAVEWNKKEELVAEQALKHLRQYAPLFSAFTQTSRSELALLVRVQEFCYENMNFMKVFQKIVLLFYKSKICFEILNFDPILIIFLILMNCVYIYLFLRS